MLNRVLLAGNLGRDPEIRSLPNGDPVANASLATSRRWKDRSGNRQEQTEWHNLVMYGKTAELASQYLTKGKSILVEGRIQTRSWDDKSTGEKKYRTEIIVEHFHFLGGGGRGVSQEDIRGQRLADEIGADNSAADDDDIPF